MVERLTSSPKASGRALIFVSMRFNFNRFVNFVKFGGNSVILA